MQGKPEMSGRAGDMKHRGIQLRVRLLVSYVAVAILPAFLICSILLRFGVQQRLSAFLGDGRDVALTVVTVLVSLLAALGVALLATRGISRRLNCILEAAAEVGVGDLDRRLPEGGRDEIGRLAASLNEMIGQLRELVSDQEQQVAVLEADLAYRSMQLETVTRVAHEATYLRDVDGFLQRVVDELAGQLHFHHVGVYLIDNVHHSVVLRSCSKSGGEHTITPGVRFAMSEASAITAVVATGQASVVPEITADRRHVGLDGLGDARSEATLPISVRNQVVGVVDVLSEQIGAFTRDDVAYLQAIADHIGLALESARLFGEAENRLIEISNLIRQQAQEGWQEMVLHRPNWAYVYDGLEVRPQSDATPAVDNPDLVIPLGAPDRQFGNVKIASRSGEVLLEGDVALAKAIVAETGQVLEQARLFQETQDAMLEVGVLYRCSRAIAEAQSAKDVLAAIIEHIPAADRRFDSQLDSGVLVRWDDAVSGKWHGQRLCVDTALGDDDRLAQLVGTVWDPAHLPILALAGDGPLAIEAVGESVDLDAVSRITLRQELGFQAGLVLPLRAGQRVSGLLSKESTPGPWGWFVIGSSTQPCVFSAREMRLYEGVSDLAAVVVRNFQLLDLASERARRAQLVGSISTRVRETLDMDLVLQTALREIGENLGISSIEVQMQPLGLEEAVDRSPIGSNGAGEACNAGGVEMERDT